MAGVGVVNTNLPKKVVTNKGFIAVLGAAVAGAPLTAVVQRLALRNPQTAQNLSIALIIGGMVLVGISAKLLSKNMTMQFFAIGASSGVVIAGLAPFLQRFVKVKTVNQ